MPRGLTSRWPATRANSTSSRQATAYRTASAVYIGAVASTPEMATLPPTMAIAATPMATGATADRGGPPRTRCQPAAGTPGGRRAVRSTEFGHDGHARTAMVRLTGPLDRLYSGPMPAAEPAAGTPPAAAGAAGAGADFLQLDPAAAPARGLTGWLVGALRAGIRDGRLPAGTVLPATRLLAGDLGVSRGVIVEAYQRLTDEGLVSARQGAGTTVLPRTPPPSPAANGHGAGHGGGGRTRRRRPRPSRRGPARPGPGSAGARAGRSSGQPAAGTCARRPARPRCWTCPGGGGRTPSSTCPRACPTCPRSPAPPGCAPSGPCWPAPARPIWGTATRGAANGCAPS